MNRHQTLRISIRLARPLLTFICYLVWPAYSVRGTAMHSSDANQQSPYKASYSPSDKSLSEARLLASSMSGSIHPERRIGPLAFAGFVPVRSVQQGTAGNNMYGVVSAGFG